MPTQSKKKTTLKMKKGLQNITSGKSSKNKETNRSKTGIGKTNRGKMF